MGIIGLMIVCLGSDTAARIATMVVMGYFSESFDGNQNGEGVRLSFFSLYQCIYLYGCEVRGKKYELEEGIT